MAPNPLPKSTHNLVRAKDALGQLSDLEYPFANPLDSDEPPLESDLHRELIELLLSCLQWWWRDRGDFYASGNLTVYYNPNQLTNRDFRGPDFFVVLGAQKRPRKSWMVWQEDDRYPNLIVEFLSDNTAKVDRTTKKALYQDTFKTPEYIWFHPHTQEFAGFRLVNGRYQSIAPNPKGWLWSQELQLYFGIQANKLRLFTPVGKLIPTPTERADRMAEMLRSLGVDPDNLI